MTASVLKRFLLLCFLISTFLCQAQEQLPLYTKIDKWLTNQELNHSSIGLYLQNAETGKVLAQTTPQLSLVPGSILKLVTTATALEKFGPDFHFETQLAYTGEIRNDSLIGNLVIVGGGDPALGSEYFAANYFNPHFMDEWLAVLKEKHIIHISGNIVADASIYEDQMIPNTWIWEDIGNYYGAGAYGLSVYDNMYKIHMISPLIAGESTKITQIEPEIPNIELDNRVLSSDDKYDHAYVFGSPLENKRIIRGTIPKNQNNFTIKASIPNPAFLLAWEFNTRLQQAGISISGIPFTSTNQIEETHLLKATSSPSLADIIRVTNHESVNLFAEHMLKHLAYRETGLGSTQKGIEIITQFWEEKGINTAGLFMADGSGLSRFNAVTAKQLTDILSYMKNKSEYSDLFFNSIPTVPNGTLYVFNSVNFRGDTLRAKSGSMTRVRCYAGIIKTISDQKILFTIMLNNFSCSQAKAIDLIEELLIMIRLSS